MARLSSIKGQSPMSTPGPQLTFFTRIAALASIAALAACADSTTNDLLAPDQALANRESADRADGGVFVSTNDANANAIKAFSRAADGSLSPLGTFATGGKGVGGAGDPLTSQSAVTLSPDHRFLFVV